MDGNCKSRLLYIYILLKAKLSSHPFSEGTQSVFASGASHFNGIQIFQIRKGNHTYDTQVWATLDIWYQYSVCHVCDLYHSPRPGAVTNSFTHIHCEDMAHDISIQVSCGTLCSLYARCYVFFHAYSLWGQQQQERGDDGSFEGWGCCTKRKSCHALQLTHGVSPV